MSGYIIEMYKNQSRDNDSLAMFNSIHKSDNQKNKTNRFVAFGEFDRISFTKVTDFSRYRDVSNKARNWIGDRQSSYIFEIDNNSNIELETNMFVYNKHEDGKDKDIPLFIGITFLQFKTNLFEKLTDINEVFENCKKNISEIVSETGFKVEHEVFGALDSLGIAIFWMSDQYVEILKIANLIKQTDITKLKRESGYIFISSYTVFAKNDFKSILEDETKKKIIENKISEVKGTALIQLTLKTNINLDVENKVKDEFGKNHIYLHSAGEHDLNILVEAKQVFSLFQKNGFFTQESKFYSENVLQSNIRLCDKLLKGWLSGITNDNQLKKIDDQLKNTLMDIEVNYDSLRKILIKKFPKTAGMVDTLDLLYSDFITKFYSSVSSMWVADFAYQFLEIEKCLLDYLEKSDEIQFDVIRALMNDFKQQVFHIAESNNLVIDTPKSHLRYTGQNNIVLYTYYGIIKSVLGLAYQMQEYNKQSKIIPLITADIVPSVSSSLFIDSLSPKTDRILTFNIPMSSLYDIPRYSVYIYHEIFHYVVPKDRFVRNELYGLIFVCEVFKSFIIEMLQKKDEKIYYKDRLIEFVEDYFMPIIFDFTITHYKELVEIYLLKIMEPDNLNINYDSDTFEWSRYEEFLSKYLRACFQMKIEKNNDIILVFLKHIYSLKNIIEENLKIFVTSNKNHIVQVALNQLEEEFKNFFSDLEGISVNQDTYKKYRDIIKSLNCTDIRLVKSARNVLDGLRELYPDMAMVELSKMTLEHYLICFTQAQKDLLENVDNQLTEADIVRIGSLIDYMLGEENSTESNYKELSLYRSKFVRLYVGLYFSKSNIDTNLKDYYDSLVLEAKAWFDKYKKCYIVFRGKYNRYAKIIQHLFNTQSLAKRNDEALKKFRDKQGDLRLQDYINSYMRYSKAIETVVNNNILTEEAKKTKISEHKNELDKNLFNINLALIYKYQNQYTFFELENVLNAIQTVEVKDNYFINSVLTKIKKYSALEEECRETYESLNSLKHIYLYPVNSIKELSEIINLTSQNSFKHIYLYSVNSIKELSEIINLTSQNLLKRNSEKLHIKDSVLWYRGQQSNKYILLPNIMRKYKDKRKLFGSLDYFQRSEFEEFKFRADGAPEIWDKSDFSICDYIALMQHYSVPTTYLDWSEDALTSLYFSLESYIDNTKKEQRDENTSAVLYVFSPNLYNRARNMIIDEVEDKIINKTNRDIDAIKTKVMSPSMLPNLSLKYNEERFNMFLLGDDSKYGQDYSKNTTTIEKLTKTEREALYLPLAIYTSRLNLRLRTQSGIFLAYNLYTPPSEGDDYNYIDLEKIQEFFFELFPNEEPFLFKIEMQPTCKENIANWIKALGISKEKIYPELTNVGERINS